MSKNRNEVIIGKVMDIQSGKGNHPSCYIVTFTLQERERHYIIECKCDNEVLMKTTKATLERFEDKKVIIFVKRRENSFVHDLIDLIRSYERRRL